MKLPIVIAIMSLGFITACSGTNSSTSIFDLNRVKQGPTILKINNQEIHQGFLDLLIELNPRIKSQLTNPMTRKKILNSLVDQQLLYQEAVKRNVNAQEDVTAKMLLNKHVIISNALIESQLNDEMKKEYEARKLDQFTKINVSLLSALYNPKAKKGDAVTDVQKAAALKKIKAMKAKLDAGEAFDKVATKDSDDKMTKKKGGLAGQISKNDRRFARLGLSDVTTAAFSLKKNQVSEPIATKKGFYLVKVTSDKEVVPFDEAQRALRFELQNKIKKTLVDSLRKGAKIEFITQKKEAVAVKKTAALPVPQVKKVETKKTEAKKTAPKTDSK